MKPIKIKAVIASLVLVSLSSLMAMEAPHAKQAASMAVLSVRVSSPLEKLPGDLRQYLVQFLVAPSEEELKGNDPLAETPTFKNIRSVATDPQNVRYYTTMNTKWMTEYLINKLQNYFAHYKSMNFFSPVEGRMYVAVSLDTQGSRQWLRQIIRQNENREELMRVAQAFIDNNNLKALDILINAGLNTVKDIQQFAEWALQYHAYDIVLYLIKNFPTDVSRWHTSNGAPFIFYAAQENNVPVMEALLNAGTQVNQLGYRKYTNERATVFDFPEVLTPEMSGFLKSHGAKIAAELQSEAS